MNTRNLFSKSILFRKGRRLPLRVRLGLTMLEDRSVPTVFTATNALDAGAGSLRQAILDSNIHAGADEVQFATDYFSVPRTITLTSGELKVTDDLTVTGPGAGLLTVSGNNASRVFNVDDGNSSTKRTVQISGLTITAGKAGAKLGGVSNSEALTLSGVNLSANLSSGVYNDTSGSLSVSGSNISGNQTYGISNYGISTSVIVSNSTVSGNRFSGIYNWFGSVTVSGSGISNNGFNFSGNGGGIYTFHGSVAVYGSTVAGNSAGFEGGGLYAFGGSITVSDSTVSGNIAGYGGGGIYVETDGGIYGGTGSVQDERLRGVLILSGSTVSGNTADNGAGLFSDNGRMTLIGSTLSGNSTTSNPDAGHGGGIDNEVGYLTITNSTLSGNTSTAYGGGIFNSDFNGMFPVLLSQATVVDNGAPVGGNIADGGGQLTLLNSLIAHARSGGDMNRSNDYGSTLVLLGVNLIEDGSVTGSNVFNADPLLAPLDYYGGPTQTMALLAGSPAINSGSTTDISIDQRGLGRVGPADLGSFESQGFTLEVVAGSNQTALVDTLFVDPLVIHVVAINALEPIFGGEVTFAGPSFGAGISPSSETVAVESDGTARIAVHANHTPGAYWVIANLNGVPALATFALTNESSTLAIPGTPSTPASPPTDVPRPVLLVSTAIGLGAEAGQPSYARLIDASSGDILQRVDPFPSFTGGVEATAADVNGDGIDDLIVAAGLGGQAHIKVFDGKDASLLLSFLAFTGYDGAVNIAAGDIDHDGHADIVVGTKSNSSHVKVFSGASGVELFSLIAFNGYNGGVSVAAGDLNGDGYSDIFVGTLVQNSHVKTFSGQGGGLLQSLVAFEGYAGGVSIAACDLDGDGFAEVMVGTILDGSHVKVFRASDSAEVASFYAYDPGYAGGVDVFSVDADRNRLADIGTLARTGSHFKAFAYPGLEEVRSFLIPGDV